MNGGKLIVLTTPQNYLMNQATGDVDFVANTNTSTWRPAVPLASGVVYRQVFPPDDRFRLHESDPVTQRNMNTIRPSWILRANKKYRIRVRSVRQHSLHDPICDRLSALSNLARDTPT